MGKRDKVKPWKVALAKNMARNLTDIEKILWNRLKDKAIGVPVYKQKILYGFIVDFYIPQAKLVIEADGPFHRNRKAYDNNRDIILAKRGYFTMRFSSDEIKTNPQVVVAMIKAKVQERCQS